MGHRINASDVEISVVPTRINGAITRLDFQVYANNAEVTGQLLSKSYNYLEITSAYGIYDHITDKMTILYTIKFCITALGVITRQTAQMQAPVGPNKQVILLSIGRIQKVMNLKEQEKTETF